MLSWLGFLSLFAAAAAIYPGGNWLDRAAPGHRFFANYFCDLTQPVSLSGVNNPVGSVLAQLAMLCFAVALGGFFWLVPWHFEPRARLRAWVRGFGECAVLGCVAVPFTPSERFGQVHALVALLSGAFGIAAALVAVWALLRSRRAPRVLGVVGLLTLVAGAVHAALFVSAQYLHASEPESLIVPAVQKLAASLLSAWMLGVAWLTLSRRRESDP
ncbi:MAG TPA: hypothetical protein VGJ91_07600 [Polyangiaceae bacterium]